MRLVRGVDERGVGAGTPGEVGCDDEIATEKMLVWWKWYNVIMLIEGGRYDNQR